MAFLNMDYYQMDNNYKDIIYKNEKEDILNYIKNTKKENYNTILEKDKRSNIYTVFSEIRSNIIRWYNFEKDCTILEVGGNFGEITEELSKKCKKITSLEFSKDKAEAILLRHQNIENLEIICGEIKNIKYKEKYDYIVAMGILEFYKQLGFLSPEELIIYLKNLLKENGKIIIATDNKFGAKYLTGAKKYEDDFYFSNFSYQNDITLFGKKELYNICKKTEFKNISFLYPFPDYKLTDVIYSDQYKPNCNEHKLKYNLYYSDNDEIIGTEFDILTEAIKNNNFEFFANSFFIELSNDNSIKTKFVSFNNLRKKEYKTILLHYNDVFEKKAYNHNNLGHINIIKNNLDILNNRGIRVLENYNNNIITSEYIQENTFDNYLMYILNQSNKNLFFDKVNDYFNFIKNKLEPLEENEKNVFDKYGIEYLSKSDKKLNFLKNGIWDLIFQNVFYKDNEYMIFDQEWYEQGVPMEFIQYRCFKYLYELNNSLNAIIPYQELLKKYNLLEYVDLFEKLEIKLLDNIVDNDIKQFYTGNLNKITSIEAIKENYKKEISKVYTDYDNLVLEYKNMKAELSKIYDKYDELVVEYKNMKAELSMIYDKYNELVEKYEINN
ncbi:MAG: methyltransferase domain-containing protein [Clostridia bacterium]|nr:methyltransferase domain-containing protein [Clostridia bacterium]